MSTLHWIGKDKVENHHLDVPVRSLDTVYTEGAAASQNKAGEAFKYFMVFDKKQLKRAYTLDKFMEILKQM